tara:strand:+ start:65102 stop:66883 length:1782 start_codon:yes stop_codon:yes gene_type:complete
MQDIREILSASFKEAINSLFELEIDVFEIQPTRKEFEGDYTLVVFPLLRQLKSNPQELAMKIGTYVCENTSEIKDFNVVKGFLNLSLSDSYFKALLQNIHQTKDFGRHKNNGKVVMVEYSSPNTNKPLHLGHIRNNLLGYSVAEILKASGAKVYKTQIINDRGIHICKSMVAWREFGNGETPESSGEKGDHLVGKYYILFDQKYREQQSELQSQGYTAEEASKEAAIFKEAQKMLIQWEASDSQTVTLWEKMNSWVYTGFSQTYKRLGVDFDKLYYESDTYLLGKVVVKEGLDKGVFYRKEDGSVWIDLTPDGLDEKIVLRSDGTAVYMTQDIGTAIQRVKDYQDITGMVYTVGNEQDYHFKVLFLILSKLGYNWSEDLYHLSYGMVDLPSGKMKSREGTIVDADDLMQDMHDTAKSISEELGKIEDFSKTQKEYLFDVIGLGALKYHILKVDPRKSILFDPQESVDFQGNTGPFIQYTYARIQSILRKNTFSLEGVQMESSISFEIIEKELIKNLNQFPETISLAANQYSPALIANYTYQLVKTFNSFYQQLSILGEVDERKKLFRLILAYNTAAVIKSAMSLLGIRVPQRM